MLTPPIPGRLTLTPGTRTDYPALARFHYLPKRPATFAAVCITSAATLDHNAQASR